MGAIIDDIELVLVSFDVSGTLPNDGAPIAFDDEDVLAYDPQLGTWHMVWDGCVELPGIESADVDAIFGGSLPPPLPMVAATASATATADLAH